VTDVRLLHGLRVASDIGLSSARVDAGPPDVRFIGEAAIVVPATLPPGRLIGTLDSPDGTPFRAISEDGGHWRLRFFDRCDVVVEPGGRTVRYWPHVDVDPDLLPIYLTGTVLAVVLMLRGHPVLHASAVEVDGKAVAFVGASGMGKSTLATAFCGQGAALITDDVLRVDLGVGDVHGNEPCCRLGATETRLRDGALRVLDGPRGVRTITADGRHSTAPDRTADDHVPLHSIVVPTLMREQDHVVARRMPPLKALMQLAAFPRVLGWDDADTNRQHFEFLGRLVDDVPVFDVELPWRTPLPPTLVSEVAAALELSWRPAASS
jgi:hypothetical protein